jgi:hypothetical protein
MNEKDKLIAKLIKEKGGTREQYLQLLDSIGYHESRLDPTIKQIGGGPGRGKYQFEAGKNAGGITAARRTKQYYKENNIPVPEWLNKAVSNNDLDASSLSSEQQDILFLGNMRKHPKADLSKVVKGEESIKDFWLNYHWAGKEKHKAERARSFEESMKSFGSTENHIPPFTEEEFNNRNIETPKQKFYKQVRDSRTGGFQNEDGTVSSHLMADDNVDTAYPTLYESPVGWTQYNDEGAKQQAAQRNELYKFNTRDEMIDFARKGAWKDPKQNVYTPSVFLQNKKANGGLTRKDRGSDKKPYPSVSSGDFAGGNRSYPIPTKADAVDALRLAGLHGRSDVRSKVFSRYPELKNNKKAMGGKLPAGAYLNETNMFGVGGTHEQNPNGGIPQGMGSNGKMNTVEEGEFSYNFEDGKYIFSDRINESGIINNTNTFAKGGLINDPPTKNPVLSDSLQPKKENKPLVLEKSQMVKSGLYGLEKETTKTEVPDVRKNFMYPNFLSTTPQKEVNFDMAIKNPGAKQFADRYNHPTTRKLLEEQTGYNQEQLDNMILKGLSPDKVIGGNRGGSQAEWNSKENKILFSPEYANNKPIETHERVHASMIDAAQGQNLRNILGSPYEQKASNKLRKTQLDLLRYLDMPQETYGNFAEFREKIGLKPGEQLTEEELIKRVNKAKVGMENFYKTYDRKKILKALNTIASIQTKRNNNTRLA